MDVTSTDDVASADELGDEPVAPAASTATATAPELDLTPRTSAASVARGGRRRWPAFALLAVILAGVGFVAFRAISDASTFFLTTDEAVAQQQSLDGRRFNLEGVVVPGTTQEVPGGVTFTLQNNGVQVTVRHLGDPPDLFQDGIPVVLTGAFASTDPGARFESDTMIVRHDNNYDVDNADRLKQAAEQGTIPPGAGGAGSGAR